VEGRPLTYYGLLARGRLAELDPERTRSIEQAQDRLLQTPAPSALHAGTLARDPHLLAPSSCCGSGSRRRPRARSAPWTARPRGAPGSGHEPLTLVAELFARAGDLRSAHAVVRTELRGLLRHPATALALRAAVLAYPLAFREEIAKFRKGRRCPPIFCRR